MERAPTTPLWRRARAEAIRDAVNRRGRHPLGGTGAASATQGLGGITSVAGHETKRSGGTQCRVRDPCAITFVPHLCDTRNLCDFLSRGRGSGSVGGIRRTPRIPKVSAFADLERLRPRTHPSPADNDQRRASPASGASARTPAGSSLLGKAGEPTVRIFREGAIAPMNAQIDHALEEIPRCPSPSSPPRPSPTRASTTPPGQTGSALGRPGPHAPPVGEALPPDARLVEPAVREVVRRRGAQRRRQLPRPARRGRPRRRTRRPSFRAGDTRAITYPELTDEVSRCANALADLGVAKGDRVAVYLPMVPEAVVAMLACARIGAIHSVVFGGFSARACGRHRRRRGQPRRHRGRRVPQRHASP